MQGVDIPDEFAHALVYVGLCPLNEDTRDEVRPMRYM